MKKILFVFGLVISLFANSQGDRMRPVYQFMGLEIADWYFPPANYVYVNQRYRWFMGMFDSGFHVPTTTVYPTLSTGQWTRAGGLKYRTTDSSFYGYTAYQWTRLASSQSVNQALANCYGLLNGLAVSYLSGLTFDVSPGDFTLGCFNFHSNGGQVTGTAAHATLARIDVVLVDTLGAVSILAGTPAADPSKPQVDPSYQLELTFYTVAALATTPTGVSSVNIYLNNAPEWTATQSNWTASVAADFNSTTDPFEGTKHILISNTGTVGPAAELKFVNGSVLNIGDYTVLKFYIKPVSNFSIVQGISLRLGNGTAFVSPLVPVRNGQFGFSRGLNSWQLITIPISAFNVTGTQFDRLYIYPIQSAKNFYLDVIQLQSGITQPGPGTGIETDPLSIHLTGTSTLTGNITVDGGDVRDVAFTINSFDVFSNSPAGYAQLFALRPTGSTGEINLTHNNTTNSETGFTSIYSSVTDTLAEFTVFASPSIPTFTKGHANYGSFIRWNNRQILINPHLVGGKLKITNLITNDDTTNYKPLARRVSDSTVVQFDHWPSGGGGGETLQQTLDLGSTLTTSETINKGNTTFIIFGDDASHEVRFTHEPDNIRMSRTVVVGGTSSYFSLTDSIYLNSQNTSGPESRFIVYPDSIVSRLVSGGDYLIKYLSEDAGTKTVRYDPSTGKLTYHDIPSGGGNVTKVGTPVNNQVGVWTGDGTLEGEANLLFASGRLSINNTGGNDGGLNVGDILLKEIVSLSTPATGYGGIYAKNDGTLHYINDAGTDIELGAGGGSGTVNAGAALKAAYYPSGAALVDDWIGVEYNNTNLNTKIIAQAATDVILELRSAGSQSADPLQILNSTGDVAFRVSPSGDALFSTPGSGGALQNPDGFETIFQIYGAGNAYFQVTSGSAYAETFVIATHPSGFWGGLGGAMVGMRTNNNLNFITNAATRATITAAGEFLIGTTTDAGDGKLQVSGNVLVAGRVLQTQGADVASAAGAIAVGSDGNTFELTGTNAVTLISNVGWRNGSEIIIVFTSTASLTDGTANSGTDIGMELAGNANFTGSADDVITLVLTEVGGVQKWREKSRTVN